MITLDNFFLSTKARFKGCKKPKREPDYVSLNKYTQEVSSLYWYGKDSKGQYVIRYSDHWSAYKGFNKDKKVIGCGFVASCYWTLKTNKTDNFLSGKCYLNNFIPF